MCESCIEEKHAGVIYGLHNGDYDFRYIGKSIDHKRRYNNHLSAAMRGEGFAVHAWIKKHGAENIQMTIIETFTDEDVHLIDEREIFHIAQARAFYGKNLNVADGGGGNTGPKGPQTDEHRANISAAMMGNQRWLGRTHSEETKAKMSQSLMGNTRHLGVNHNRWHVKRNIVNPDCQLCQQ